MDRYIRSLWIAAARAAAPLMVIGSAWTANADGLLCAARDIIARNEMAGGLGISLDGQFAYVARGGLGLVILDVSDQANPQVIGSCDTPGSARRVAMMGDYALVADSTSGMQVVRISDPASPEIVGELAMPDSAYDIERSGAIAYIAAYGQGLQIADVSDPANPVIVGALDTPGLARDLCVRDGIAYIADGDGGMRVVDVSDPAGPLEIGWFGSGYTRLVEVSGTLAFLAVEDSLVVLDVTDPSQPTLLSSAPAAIRPASDIAIDGSRVYLDGGASVFDVTNPAHPLEIGNYPIPGNQAMVQWPIALVATQDDFLVVDMSSPPQSGSLGYSPADDYMESVGVSGSYAYVADGFAGLHVIDVSDASNPVRVATIDTGGWTHDVVLQNEYAYVADLDQAFKIIDVSEPTAPIVIGDLPSAPRLARLDVDGEIACVIGGDLHIVDIADPSEPYVLAQHSLPFSPRDHGDVQISDGLAFVAKRDFHIYDLSRPTEAPIAELTTPSPVFSVAVRGSLACVAGHDGLAIYEISVPTAPQLLSEMPLDALGATRLEISGDTLYVAMELDFLRVLDISVPTSPRLVTTAARWIPVGQYDVQIEDGIAYVVDILSGLHLMDISDCPPCPADFDGDGVADSRDVIAFLNAWVGEREQDCSSGGCSTDLDMNGVVDSRDFVQFLNLWAAGC